MRNKIKCGICGLGRIGQVHCRHFHQAAQWYEMTAVCDLDVTRTRDLANQYGCAGYTSYEEFLQHPEMELAIIATRSLDHAANAVQALAAGKTVLLEKPIAVTEDDYHLLRRADRDYPGKLFFLHNHRFEPAFESIQRILASGVLGTAQVIKLCRHHGFVRRTDWQMLLRCGGGQLSVWGPHLLDQALQYLGAPVKEVWGRLQRILTPGDADDHLKVLLTGENGVLAELEISNAVALPGAYCTIYGTRGTLICADEKTIHLKYIQPDYCLPDLNVSEALQPLGGGYGREETFPWVESTVAVEPQDNMWEYVETALVRHLYRALRENIPFPIRNHDAFEVVRITNLLKAQNSQFAWLR